MTLWLAGYQTELVLADRTLVPTGLFEVHDGVVVYEYSEVSWL